MKSFTLDDDIKDVPNHPEHRIGQKLKIIDYSLLCLDTNDIVKLSRFDAFTVVDSLGIPIGENGDYHWEYEVYVSNPLDDSELKITCGHYKLI